jgi:hypothetical protein
MVATARSMLGDIAFAVAWTAGETGPEAATPDRSPAIV